VTGVLGINDMHFSDVPHWVLECADPYRAVIFQRIDFDRQRCQDHADAHLDPLEEEGKEFSDALNVMFSGLSTMAGKPGVKVVVPGLYNPMHSGWDCEMTYNIADVIVKTLNAELDKRSTGTSIRSANTYDAFKDHGSGSSEPYVFGDDCSDKAGVGRGIASKIGELFGVGDAGGLQRHYDPHPNDRGAQAIADKIVAAYHGL